MKTLFGKWLEFEGVHGTDSQQAEVLGRGDRTEGRGERRKGRKKGGEKEGRGKGGTLKKKYQLFPRLGKEVRPAVPQREGLPGGPPRCITWKFFENLKYILFNQINRSVRDE